MKRLSIVSGTALMVAILGSTPVGHAEPAPSQKFVPFVTDFPKPEASTATDEPFVPFVTDFPKPGAVSVPTGS